MRIRKFVAAFLSIVLVSQLVISEIGVVYAETGEPGIVEAGTMTGEEANTDEGPAALIEISGFGSVENISVPIGVPIASVSEMLQKQIAITTQQGNENIAVSWESEDYLADVAGNYSFKALIVESELYSLAENVELPTITVTVTEKEADSESFSAVVNFSWNGDELDEKPQTDQLKNAVVNGLAAENTTLPEESDFVFEESENGWNLTISNLLLTQDDKAVTYTLAPSLDGFVFSFGEADFTVLSAEPINAEIKPALPDKALEPLMPLGNGLSASLSISSSYFGGSGEISYSYIYDGIGATDINVTPGEDEIIEIPIGKTVTITVKSDVFTWGGNSRTVTINGENDSVSFQHSINAEPIIAKINWNDNNNAAEKRPSDDNILSLSANISDSAMLPDPNIDKTKISNTTWIWTYSGLPKFDKDGNEIAYEIEATVQANYTKEVLTPEAGTNFYFRYTAEAAFSAEVNWLDNNNKYQSRPTLSVANFELYSNGTKSLVTLSEHLKIEGTTLSLSGLPAFDADGAGYLYSLKLSGKLDSLDQDETIYYNPGYSNVENMALDTERLYNGGELSLLLTASYTFNAKKVWLDDGTVSNRQDGTLTIQRYVDGETYLNAYPIPNYDSTIKLSTLTPTDGTREYAITFGGTESVPLDRYDEVGRKYIYFVAERLESSSSKDSYQRSFANVAPYNTVSGSNSYLFEGGTVTNLRVGNVNLDVEITWNTAAQQSVTSKVVLRPQRKLKTATEWTNMEAVTVGDFYAEQLTLTKSFSWDKYDENGIELEYRVVETNAEVNGDKQDVVNGAFRANGFSYKVTTSSVSNGKMTILHELVGNHTLVIKKVWKNSSGAPKAWPEDVESLSFNLMRDGVLFSEYSNPSLGISSGVVKMPADTPDATITLDDLPAYDPANGRAYSYDVRETTSLPIYRTDYGYEVDLSGDPKTTITVSNIESQGLGKTVIVRKIWKDGGDTALRRNVKVTLYKDDVDIGSTTLSAANNWWAYMSVHGFTETNKLTIKEQMIKGGDTYDVVAGDKATITTDEQVYEVEYSEVNKNESYTVTNKRIGVVTVNVDASTWIDGNPGDNPVRPNIKLTLTRKLGSESETVSTVTLDGTADETEKAPWKTSFENLEKYDENGNLYSYSVSAEYINNVGDYVISQTNYSYVVGEYHTNDIASYVFENRRTSVLGNFTVNLFWMDGGRAGRPNAQLNLSRTANGSTEKVNVERDWDTTPSDWHWKCSFGNLPKYDNNGYEYTYSVEGALSTVGDYKYYYSASQPTEEHQFNPSDLNNDLNSAKQNGTVIFRREAERVILGIKTWKNLPDGVASSMLPDTTFNLKYYKYKADEHSENGMTVNSESEGFDAMINGSPVTAELKGGDSTFNFGSLARYDDYGRDMNFFIDEALVNGYAPLRGDIGQFNLENVYGGGSVDVGTVKVTLNFNDIPEPTTNEYMPVVTVELWRHMEDSAGNKIGSEYKVETKTHTATKDGTNTVEFTGKEVYAPNGLPWVYTVKEVTVNGYTTDKGSSENGYMAKDEISFTPSEESPIEVTVTIENTYTGGDKRAIKVKKAWNDSENLYKTRPSDMSTILVTLHRRGDGSDETQTTATLASVNASEGHSFTNLLTYAPNGNAYVYSITEDEIKGYDGIGAVEVGNKNEITITNRLKTTEFTAKKYWKLNSTTELKKGNSSYGLLPDDMKITLQLERTINDADWAPLVYGDKNSYELALSSFNYQSGYYSYKWSNLPKYDSKGNEYTYRVREIGLSSVTQSAALTCSATATEIGPFAIAYNDNSTITNTLNQNTTIKVQPIWADENNQDGIRPDSVKFTVKGTASDQVVSAEISVKKPSEADISGFSDEEKLTHWGVSEITLPYENLNKIEIKYAASNSSKSPDGYTVEHVESSNDPYQFKFSHTPKTLTINLTKDWGLADDSPYASDYADAISGLNVFAKLLSDGTVQPNGNVKQLTAQSWKCSWENLPASENTGYQSTAATGTAKVIKYSVKELATENGEPLTNGIAPFLKAPTYSPEEFAASGSLANTDAIVGELKITNELETIDLAVTENWVDSSNLYKTRPTEANGETKSTVKLQRKSGDSFIDYSSSIILTTASNSNTAADEWKALPKFAPDGTSFEYRVLETHIGSSAEVVNSEDGGLSGKGYNYKVSYGKLTTVNGKYTIEFTNSVETTVGDMSSITVKKIWEDDDNRDGKRPESVKVTLKRDNVAIEQATLSQANSWQYKWDNLPKYKDSSASEQSVYTIIEDAVADYTTAYSGEGTNTVTVTNTHISETIAVTANVNWVDGGVTDARPISVNFTLQFSTDSGTTWNNCLIGDTANNAGYTPTQTLTPTIWTGVSWSNLYKYNNGTAIKYRVVENDIAGYTSDSPVEVPESNTVTITNTRKLIGTATVVWDDFDNKWGIRPAKDGSNFNITTIGTVAPNWKADTNGNTWNSNLIEFSADQSFGVEFVPANISNCYTLAASQPLSSGNLNVEFNYKLKTGKLMITKRFGGGVPEGFNNTEFVFYLTVKYPWQSADTIYIGEYSVGSSEKTTDEKGRILLKKGETASIELPAGTICSIEEIRSAGFKEVPVQGGKTISDGTTTTVTFENTLRTDSIIVIENTTNNQSQANDPPKGGTVIAGDQASSPDKVEAVTDKMKWQWAPEPNWGHDNTLKISWYGNGTMNEVIVNNYLKTDGNIDVELIKNELGKNWTDVEVEATINEGKVNLTLADNNGTPIEAAISVGFVPTFAVLNITQNQQGGQVGFNDATLDDSAYGVSEPRYGDPKALIVAKENYYVDIASLSIGVPQAFQSGSGSNVKIAVDSKGPFKVDDVIGFTGVELNLAQQRRARLMTQSRATAGIILEGEITIKAIDSKGRATKVELVVTKSSAAAPLDLAVKFVTESNNGSNTRPSPPTNNSGYYDETTKDSEEVATTEQPTETTDPGRGQPPMGDNTTKALVKYALLSALAGLASILLWRGWRKSSSQGDEE